MAVQVNKTYTQEYDNLIAATYPELVTGSFLLTPGQKVLKRGSLLAVGEDGKAALVKETITAGTPVFVLADDVDTGTTNSGNGVSCTGYRQGHFLEDRLITGDSYKLVSADIECLRQYNIFTSTGVEAKGV